MRREIQHVGTAQELRQGGTLRHVQMREELRDRAGSSKVMGLKRGGGGIWGKGTLFFGYVYTKGRRVEERKKRLSDVLIRSSETCFPEQTHELFGKEHTIPFHQSYLLSDDINAQDDSRPLAPFSLSLQYYPSANPSHDLVPPPQPSIPTSSINPLLHNSSPLPQNPNHPKPKSPPSIHPNQTMPLIIPTPSPNPSAQETWMTKLLGKKITDGAASDDLVRSFPSLPFPSLPFPSLPFPYSFIYISSLSLKPGGEKEWEVADVMQNSRSPNGIYRRDIGSWNMGMWWRGMGSRRGMFCFYCMRRGWVGWYGVGWDGMGMG